jgi:S-methylmethionine-dependent homocysteine/selenocysteine methylase
MFIGDGGLETTMIFREGIELPCFASFLLLRGDEHVQLLRRYYASYLEVAHRHQVGAPRQALHHQGLSEYEAGRPHRGHRLR